MRAHLTPSAATDAFPERDLVTRLLSEALARFDNDRTGARVRVEQARSLIVGARAAEVARGGLTGWRARQIRMLIDANLAQAPKLYEAAPMVRLSPSHFARAFKVTFGITYGEYVLSRRLEHARLLLLTTDQPISQIALACGLSDQSHLTRLFSRQIGLTPGAWRRAHQGAPFLITSAPAHNAPRRG